MSSTLTWLRSSLSTTLRLFMSTSPPDIWLLFPKDTISLEVGVRSSLLMEISQEEPCRILSLEYRKCTTQKAHEFLVVKILHVVSSHTTLIMLDRSPQNDNSSKTTSSLVSAFDQVCLAGWKRTTCIVQEFEPCSLLASMTFEDSLQSPTLFQLAVLLLVIHKQAPNYNPVRDQCYWFANIIWSFMSSGKYGGKMKFGLGFERKVPWHCSW